MQMQKQQLLFISSFIVFKLLLWWLWDPIDKT